MPSTNSDIGILLAVSGNLLISVGLNVQKYAHNVNQSYAELQPFVTLPLWWVGLLFVLIGELGNFAAYGFTEASVIAPLGAVSVLANAFIAALILGEGLRMRDVFGCFLCVCGGVVIVMRPTSNVAKMDIGFFMKNIEEPALIAYVIVLTAVVTTMLGFQDKYAHQHVAYYVLLCSLIGSVTVMACKGVSSFLTLWMCCGMEAPFNEPVLYCLLLVLVSTAILQIRYLNLAMQHFGNTETVPVYYVIFSICTIFGSNILYKDFESCDLQHTLAFGGGCLLTFCGVQLLTSKRPRGGGSMSTSVISSTHYETSSSTDVGEPPLHSLYQAYPTRFRHDVDMGELSLPPLTLINTPMGVSGDTLRRTFSHSPPSPSAVRSIGTPVYDSVERDAFDSGVRRGTL
mmetsp:Transcript_32288/g.53371  ORF Transcript_32288/g.53371 Transcript_32288/m.53371 type:complete len:400 (+) Transcript_32288:88-1287(+)|eukprot:CAMPEP_0119305550 /NCGR_PEP_ID=MMETSP1333-20130426/6523_1 /TAXON_ID=418940 /ORGANISM="Scyphosphaera apsteinii, Strain RCC1455" /LENGTH=399 /DNA_ID=CAMNT_0007308673 /DNA_START=81 /DNA_END=1280 /DNA_ORIENTATION=-